MTEKQFYAHTDSQNPDKTPEQGANWQKTNSYCRQYIKGNKYDE